MPAKSVVPSSTRKRQDKDDTTIRLSNRKTVELKVGTKYKVIHKSSMQRYNRMSIMRWMGNRTDPQYYPGGSGYWDARTVAGTQELPWSWVVDIEGVSQDARIVLNVRA